MIVGKMPENNGDNLDSVGTTVSSGLLPAAMNQLLFAPDIDLIEQWLSQLPMANAPKTCQVFFEFLRITNDRSVQPDIRFNILELIKKNFEIVGPALGARFIDRDWPLDRRSEEFAVLGLGCTRKLGEGYRIIIGNAAFANLQRDLRLKVLYRFLECQSGISLQYAQLYKQRPVGFWAAIYRVYRIAESMDLHNEIFVSDKNKPGCQPTIAALFRQILLLFLSQTDCYRQQTHQQIFNLLAKYSSLLALSKDPEMNSRKAVFAFDFEQDTPPKSVRYVNTESSSAACYLFTRPMVESMIAGLKSESTLNNRRSGVSTARKSLTVELARNLGAPMRRRAIRVNENEERILLVGMQSITAAVDRLGRETPGFDVDRCAQNVNQGRKIENTYLYGGGKSSRFKPKSSYIKVPDYDLIPIDEGCDGNVLSSGPTVISGRPNSEIWKGIKPVSETTSSEIWKESSPVAEKPTENHHVKQQKKLCGTLLDSSIRGYALRWDRSAIAQIKVGELIGFPMDNKRIEVGVIRRICSRDEHLDLGIELLSPDVGFSEILVSKGNGQPLRSLRFADRFKADKPGESLLVQGANLSTGDIVHLAVKGVTMQVSVGKLIETTASFRRYTILPLDSNDQKAGLKLIMTQPEYSF